MPSDAGAPPPPGAPQEGLPDPVWLALGASVRGPSHARVDKPNQDAWASGPIDGGVVLAVADGHGSAACFRSDTGARLAVEAAVACGPEVVARLADAASAADAEAVLRGEVAPLLAARWAAAVDEDLAERPLAAGEWSGARPPSASDASRAYGSTLLACYATERWAACLQIGDGDLLAVAVDGSVTRPLPGDERLVANETTSLCLPDAAAQFRVGCMDLDEEPCALLIAATDGYANSFASATADEWAEAVGADMLQRLAEHGAVWVEERLDGWLAESAEHSGDDTTMGLLCLPARLASVRAEATAPDATPDPARDKRAAAPDPDAPAHPAGTQAGSTRAGGRLRAVVALLSAVLLGVVAGAAGVLLLGPDPSSGEVTADGYRWRVDGETVHVADVETGDAVATVTIGAPLGAVGASAGALWIPDATGRVLFRIDSATLRWRCVVIDDTDGDPCAGIAVDQGAASPSAPSPPDQGADP